MLEFLLCNSAKNFVCSQFKTLYPQIHDAEKHKMRALRFPYVHEVWPFFTQFTFFRLCKVLRKLCADFAMFLHAAREPVNKGRWLMSFCDGLFLKMGFGRFWPFPVTPKWIFFQLLNLYFSSSFGFGE